ncbi:Clp amino terminal domain containing protein [Babesia bovis T2Bo]|uniref:Clp amino terminal domain containing protein n=1 Tax=Babesia bovis TaxID=5865 RepID=A7APH1_BABBO|nr:Clp amino terminal domain containing protein [Babesia bovis T2Bo]EDO08455.1 Clp amino terminal domain containing protein [Babesia bovis T2Bo]|eukprot:XP_001612023.1 Clp amino terminal domain containing protein [Babesia bovis T2Bo]
MGTTFTTFATVINVAIIFTYKKCSTDVDAFRLHPLIEKYHNIDNRQGNKFHRQRCYASGESTGNELPEDQQISLNFNNFSDDAVKVLMLSQEEAKRGAVKQIEIKHILLGLVAVQRGIASNVLSHFGVTSKKLRDVIDNLEDNTIPPDDKNEDYNLIFSQESKNALQLSSIEAESMGNKTLETEHILLGMLGTHSYTFRQILDALTVNIDAMRNLTLKYIAEEKEKPAEEMPTDTWKQALSQYTYIPTPGRSEDILRDTYQVSPLNAFTIDITRKAEEGKLQKVLCRDSEIDRSIRTLCRKYKRNPILIGEPGVGKTAVVEGIAMQLREGHVLEKMLNKRLRQLDVGLLVAGARFRGQFEERLTRLIEEIKNAKNIILVIDEAHMLVGAGAGEGALDAANLLKPTLARGEIQCIAITTPKEYQKHFEKDAALCRRFQPIHVKEPSDKDTQIILNATAEACGRFHNVKYNMDAVAAALKYSKQFIPERYLPDKAIDILDEAGSLAKIRFYEQLKVEWKHAVNPLKERGVYDVLTSNFAKNANNEAIESDVHSSKVSTQHSEANIGVDSVTDVAKMPSQTYKGYHIDGSINFPATDMISEENYDTEYTSNASWDSDSTETLCEVNTEHVAEVVSNWTGVPLKKLTQGEIEAIRNLEQELHKSVVGHEEAVKNIAKAIRRAKTNIKNPERPIGSFLFCGPPGVGKSEIAKTLTKLMFTEDNLIKLDMSEYNEPHSISRILGSPPGYKGHDSGGQLTEKLRKNPYSVVMFDEIEKAHRNVLNILLQILEDGKLTDSKNQTVSFKNTIIIMTSNVGSHIIEKAVRGIHTFGFNIEDVLNDKQTDYEKAKKQVCDELKSTFKPELIDRIDDVILFRPLNEQQMKQIAKLMIEATLKRAKDAGIDVVVDDSFIDHIMKLPRDATGGARPIRRLITTHLDDQLADFVISKDYIPGIKYRITVDSNAQIKIKSDKKTSPRKQGKQVHSLSPLISLHTTEAELQPLVPALNEVDI